jgi:uncharacterized Zn-finger protein
MNQSAVKKTSTSNKVYTVKASDLSVSCPTKDSPTWNTHPRVYLDLSTTGEATCQYCSNHFVLTDK